MRKSLPQALLAGALLSLLAASTAAQKRAPDPAQNVRVVLEGVRGPGDIVRASAELAELGPAALEALFARLASAADALTAAQRSTLTCALGALPHEVVLAFLARVARAPRDEGERIAGFALLASFGERDALKLALDLASPAADEEPLAPGVRTALEQALAAICEREEGAALVLTSFFSSVSAGLQASIVAAVGCTAGEQVPALLAALLGSGKDADALLLLELGNRAARHGACEDELVLERVRGYLGHPERTLGVLACLALEKLRDYDAVPDLVVLLEDANPALRQRAHAALRSLTGLNFRADTESWMAWLSPALDWWEQRADPVRVALVSGSPAEAAAALAEVARQRLFVGDVVQVLELALGRPEPDLVRGACQALASIREPCAVRALERAVELADASLQAELQLVLARAARPRAPERHPPTIPTLPRSLSP